MDRDLGMRIADSLEAIEKHLKAMDESLGVLVSNVIEWRQEDIEHERQQEQREADSVYQAIVEGGSFD